MKKFFSLKKTWLLIAILVVVGWWLYISSAASSIPDSIETGLVETGDVVEVVSETGFVQAMQSVDMAFERGGRVVEIVVQEGSVVQEGDVLVRLDATTAAADLASAVARLEAEQVRLRELVSGADANSLAVTESGVVSAQTALANAKKNLAEVTAQQNQLVANAKKTLLTSDLRAYLVEGERENSNDSFLAPVISGTYASEQEGVYRLEVYSSDARSGASYRVSGLGTGVHSVSTVSPTPLGAHGLFVQFPSSFAKRTRWEVPIPNTRSATYVTNLNTYNAVLESRDVAIAANESAVEAAQGAVNQGQTQLTQVASSARDEKVAAQEALVRQMQAAAASAQAQYNNMTLIAPFSGVVTSVFTEVGQIVTSGVPAVSLISQGQYELIVSISEVDIAEISVGDEARVHFDAYDDDFFRARVERISPSAKLIDGVRVFEVTLVFDEVSEKIRDGLSADIDITTARREEVISIPTRSIYEDADGKFVRSITSNEEVQEIRIETGLRGSDGKTEVVSGLSGGETIITFASEDDIAELEK